jgi:predicted membrane chloride channel (bestrophin family)
MGYQFQEFPFAQRRCDRMIPRIQLVISLHAHMRFLGPDVAGDEIGELFGKMSNHLPLDALCRTNHDSHYAEAGEPPFDLTCSIA